MTSGATASSSTCPTTARSGSRRPRARSPGGTAAPSPGSSRRPGRARARGRTCGPARRGLPACAVRRTRRARRDGATRRRRRPTRPRLSRSPERARRPPLSREETPTRGTIRTIPPGAQPARAAGPSHRALRGRRPPASTGTRRSGRRSWRWTSRAGRRSSSPRSRSRVRRASTLRPSTSRSTSSGSGSTAAASRRPKVTRQGQGEDTKIIVDLPGKPDQNTIQLVEQSAQLQFRAVLQAEQVGLPAPSATGTPTPSSSGAGTPSEHGRARARRPRRARPPSRRPRAPATA